MDFILCAIKVVVAWPVMFFVGMNLCGMALGGLSNPMASYKTEDDFIASQVARMKRGFVVSSVFFVLLLVAYLVLLWSFLGGIVLAAGTLLMMSRLPDQLREIRTGERATPGNAPSTVAHTVAHLGMLAALPLLWFGLC